MAAMAVFESGFRENMTRADAIALVSRAIRSGIFNDLGSGSNVDVCVITKDKTEMLRNYEMPVSPSLAGRGRFACLFSPTDGFFRTIAFSRPWWYVQNERGLKARDYKFRPGTTAWTKEEIRSLIVKEEVTAIPASLPTVTAGGDEGMDMS